jgi:hypothetical protein
MAKQALRVFKDQLVHRGQPARRDQLVHKVLRVYQELVLDQQDRKVQLVPREFRDQQDLKVLQGR